MHTIKLRSHVGSDGILKLQIPVGVQDTEIEVIVIVESRLVRVAETNYQAWRPGFFEETFGSIPDLERFPQGALPEREPLE
jgi:hypothetical protein